MNNTHTYNKRGFILLLSVLVAGIVLAVGLSILSIALKQFKISSIGVSSELAFQAANAGLECVRYWDISNNGNKFDVGVASGNVDCFDEFHKAVLIKGNQGRVDSGDEQTLQFSWDNDGRGSEVCTDISVWKFYEDPADDGDTNGPSMSSVIGYSSSCSEGVECTVIRSRGYNRACADLDTKRTVERELFMRY